MSNLNPVRKLDLTLHGRAETVSRGLLEGGIIVNALVDANAEIAQSKIAGLVDDLATLQTNIENEETRAMAAESALSTEISEEVSRALAAESDIDERIQTIEAKAYYEAFIYQAVGGETTLSKPVGAPSIPNSAATEVYIDGRKVFRGSDLQFTVANDGSSISFLALSAGQSVELRYLA